MSAHHVLAALAHPRAQWPTAVARWATSGAAAVELLTCLSPDELNAVIGSGRPLSAVLLDGTSSRVDQVVVAAVQRCGAVPVGVHALDVPTDWESLGVTSVLPADFGRDELMELLEKVCSGRAPAEQHDHSVTLGSAEKLGTVIGVCGPGGCGTSVVSMALAQGFADGHTTANAGVDSDSERRTLLIDGARRAHLAMYHHTGDVIPALPDLAHRIRRGTFDTGHLDEMTFPTRRGYRLLLGAPTPRDDVDSGAGVMSETLRATARQHDVVVVDHDGDQPPGTLSAALHDIASAWLIVAGSGIKGLHDAARFTHEACSSGIPPERVLVVCNRLRRRDPARIAFPVEFSRIVTSMGLEIAPPLLLPITHLEPIHRDATPLPRSIVSPVTKRVSSLVEDHRSAQDSTRRALAGAGSP